MAMTWTELLALLTFGVAGSGSPGPNNTLLLASGIRFGFKRTMPHVFGAAAGVGALVMAVAAGVGQLLEAFPGGQSSLKVIGSIYLIYLALRLASSHSLKSGSVSKPLKAWEASIFQFVNPKAWIFAIALVAAFLPPSLPPMLGGLLVATIFAVVSAATFTIWALGGATLNKLLVNERAMYLVNLVLAVLLVGSVALLWI